MQMERVEERRKATRSIRENNYHGTIYKKSIEGIILFCPYPQDFV